MSLRGKSSQIECHNWINLTDEAKILRVSWGRQMSAKVWKEVMSKMEGTLRAKESKYCGNFFESPVYKYVLPTNYVLLCAGI